MYTKKVMAYFKKKPNYNSLVHLIGGMGLGILITYPLVQTHPVRVGVALVFIAVLGHLYPIFKGK